MTTPLTSMGAATSSCKRCPTLAAFFFVVTSSIIAKETGVPARRSALLEVAGAIGAGAIVEADTGCAVSGVVF